MAKGLRKMGMKTLARALKASLARLLTRELLEQEVDLVAYY
jgi:hypothetical protein